VTDSLMPSFSAKSQDAIEQALRLAIHYHAGQRDKAGECYMLHLMRVMLACSTPEAMQVAVLHDVLEDTSAKAEELIGAGMAREVVEAVILLTKPDGMAYEEYVVRLSGNELAKQVKIADIHDNYRLDRVAYRRNHGDEDRQRIERYILSHDFLTGEICLEEYLGRMASIE
jgi:(p)ppGpp synthase/HD superfamily hydrolase